MGYVSENSNIIVKNVVSCLTILNGSLVKCQYFYYKKNLYIVQLITKLYPNTNNRSQSTKRKRYGLTVNQAFPDFCRRKAFGHYDVRNQLQNCKRFFKQPSIPLGGTNLQSNIQRKIFLPLTVTRGNAMYSRERIQENIVSFNLT